MNSSDMEWWRGAVLYQIYPRSFLDSNGDGIGDLQGVIDGLDYVASLGVDGVWLSPFFTSPMEDYGYDVADYCDVDPIFGSLNDFDRLIKKAHGFDLKIIIDQVYSHTSDRHAWFSESRADRTNAKADWYVWADAREDGAPPNNWLSVFGGSAWTWDGRRKQYYLHNFLTSQPDLNLHNRDVQDALLRVGRFWLDRGVDGFRLDAIDFAMHDPELRDNPPVENVARPLDRPYLYQQHIRNKSFPKIPDFLERIRLLTNEYDGVFTVAEIGGPDPLGEAKKFTAEGRRLNSAYDFSFLYADKINASRVINALAPWNPAPGGGWPSWAFSNHDAPRAMSRWADDSYREKAAKLFAMALLSLRGNVFIYQGEELGLPQAHVAFEDLKDPEAIANWPNTLGRDGARTPIPWASDAPNAGFSSGRPWLPVDKNHPALAVDAQESNKDSALHFIRKLIDVRSNSAALKHGAIDFIEGAPPLLAFIRSQGDQRLLCVFNLTDSEQELRPLDANTVSELVALGVSLDGGLPETVPPYSGFIATVSR